MFVIYCDLCVVVGEVLVLVLGWVGVEGDNVVLILVGVV